MHKAIVSWVQLRVVLSVSCLIGVTWRFTGPLQKLGT